MFVFQECPHDTATEADTHHYFRTSLTKQIKIGINCIFIFVILLMGTSIWIIKHINDDITRVVETNTPLEEAVFELEVNAGEMALAVQSYLQSSHQLDIQHIREAQSDISECTKVFGELVDTAAEKRLYKQSLDILTVFGESGERIIQLSPIHQQASRRFFEDSQRIHSVIDRHIDSLRASAQFDTLDEVIHLKMRFGKVVNAFSETGNIFRIHRQNQITLCDSSVKNLGTIIHHLKGMRFVGFSTEDFDNYLDNVRRLLRTTLELASSLGTLETQLAKFDRLLEEKILPVVQLSSQQAKVDAQRSSIIGISTIIATLLTLISVLVAIVGISSRYLARKLGMIMDSAERFGKGDLDHRIQFHELNEFGVIAHAFNEMAERRQEAEEALTEAMAKIEVHNKELEKKVADRTAEILEVQDLTVFSLAKLADSRDPETGEHLIRLRTYSQILAKQLSKTGPYKAEIDESFLNNLYRASPLHDIGKVGIPDSILLKPGPLTKNEISTMRQHVCIGADALENGMRQGKAGEFLRMAADVARYHHERFDGSGYCLGLTGHSIPLSARIVALADVFDALTSERVYKAAYPPSLAREMILEESGKHFDPAIVEAFELCFAQYVEVIETQCLGTGEHPNRDPQMLFS